MPKRFTKEDKKHIVEHICDSYSTRKRNRSHREKIWKEIDRQIAMEPDISNKVKPQTNQIDEQKRWLPETELPWQAQTLEITTADARRMQFPDAGPWFTPHVALTDDYLERVDYAALITGDLNEVPSLITQDNANKLVHGIMEHWHRQYNFYESMDLINAEATKYGLGIGRAKVVQKSIFLHESKGVHKKDDLIPALIPRSVWNTYLDDNDYALMNEGYAVTGSVIYEETKLLRDIEIAASKGSNDPMDTNGGWMPKNVAKLDPDDKGQIQLLEYEGDMVVPRATTTSIFVPNTVITIAVGENNKEIIRIRFNKQSFSSYIGFPYHVEDQCSPYSTSPCMKGYSLQVAAVDAMNKLFVSGALKNNPPISYDKDDVDFAKSGGPLVFPGAQWQTLGDINVHDEVGGDPAIFYSVFEGLRREYSNVTGTDAPRLGAQTVSHTTAYAKEAELARGTIRTVDYVRTSLKGGLARWLDIEYQLGKEIMQKTDVYIPAYNGFVTINKKHLPDTVVFEAHGSGGPAEEQAKRQERLQSLQLAMNFDNLRMQQQVAMGQPPTPKLNLDKVIEQTLLEGGWTDIDAITSAEAPQGAAQQTGMAGNPVADQSGLATSALQGINFGPGG